MAPKSDKGVSSEHGRSKRGKVLWTKAQTTEEVKELAAMAGIGTPQLKK